MMTRPLHIGKFEIPEPCPVPWEAMQAIDRCRRHCSQCNKVVHDLTGKTLAEIERIYAATGGALCATFSLDAKGQPILGESSSNQRKPIYLRHLAAAASLVLIYHAPQAKPIAIVKPRMELPIAAGGRGTVPTEKTNTLVSGVIVDGYGESIHDSLLVRVLQNGEVIAKGYASFGLFRFDLSGKLKPEDRVVIHVSGNKFDPGVRYEERSYGSAELSVDLGHAQNLNLKVKFTPPEPRPRKLGGAMQPRDR